MLKRESMKAKKLKRGVKREAGLSNRKKVGLGWDSTLKEAKAHNMKFKKKVIKS